MSSTPLSVLQDLIRVIVEPRSDSRFVILSKSTQVTWTIQVGLVGEDQIWWGATWKEDALQKAPELKRLDVCVTTYISSATCGAADLGRRL